jgi:hypothetical protein
MTAQGQTLLTQKVAASEGLSAATNTGLRPCRYLCIIHMATLLSRILLQCSQKLA